MKKILKFTLLIAFSLALQNQIWSNLVFSQNVWTIIKVAFIMAIFEILLKPVIKILLLPINILTLGLFRLVINTVGFYLAVFLLSDFQVNPIHTLPFIWQGFSIPAINVAGFWIYVINSTTQNFFLSIFKFIIKPKKDKK
jgi:putative membrane protein